MLSSMTSESPVSEPSNEWLPVNRSNVTDDIFPCSSWQHPQHVLFQVANACFCISYLSPSTKYGILVLHGLLILGFLLFSTWAWNVICAPDIFSWNFVFMLINMGQTLYILYKMRKVKFLPELEDVYTTLFKPAQVSRLLFKKLIGMEYAQVLSLHPGEAYAMQDLTRTDRLGLLVSGKINVMSDHQFLHHIYPLQFLDSPEFESCKVGADDKFKVTIVAATACKYIFWQRSSLEYLFVKESYLSTVMSILIARDITTKLYSMNRKLMTEKGSYLDIRLPSVASTLTSGNTSHADGIHQTPKSPRTPLLYIDRKKEQKSKNYAVNHIIKDKSQEITDSDEYAVMDNL